MAPVVYHFIYYWYSPTGLPPGAQMSWSFGPSAGFWKQGFVATAHPRLWDELERVLTVSMIQSRRAGPGTHFIDVFVRNVGPNPVYWYNLWLTIIDPQV
jgi:hypothetical protein